MTTLSDVQNQALSALSRDPRGHIDVHVRQQMWTALGPVSEWAEGETGGVPSVGHRARASLMCDCLRSALPIWRAETARAAGELLLDARDDPDSVVRYADAWLAGRLSWDEVHRHAERYQDLSFYLFELHERFPKVELIGHACRSVLWIATWDQASDYEPEYREVDNEAFPADFMIAWLFSGAGPWEDAGPDAVERRREFWQWYIVDAFARAWQVAHSGE